MSIIDYNSFFLHLNNGAHSLIFGMIQRRFLIQIFHIFIGTHLYKLFCDFVIAAVDRNMEGSPARLVFSIDRHATHVLQNFIRDLDFPVQYAPVKWC